MNYFNHDDANYMYFRKCHDCCEFKKRNIIPVAKY